MAEINVPSLLNDFFSRRHDGEFAIGVDMSTACFLQFCVQSAVWKDRAEALSVLQVLVELADHESVSRDDSLGGDFQR